MRADSRTSNPTASPEGTDLVVVGISELATPVGRTAACGQAAGQLLVIPDAAVASCRGEIRYVGPRAGLPVDISGSQGTSVLDLGGRALLPGFVDAHTHAVHVGSREAEFRQRLEGASYESIAAAGGGIVATVRATRQASLAQLEASLRERLDRMLLRGTTTAEVKSGYGLDVETELRLLRAIRTVGAGHPVTLAATFLGAHSVPPEYRADREAYLSLVCDEALPAVAAEGLAAFCDVFCEQGVFTVEESRRVLLRARELGLGLKVHADELAPSGAAELAAELQAVSAEHLMRASDAGIAALAAAGVVAVLLPGTSLFLMKDYARAARFREAGCAVAVATDLNPGTCPTDNLPLIAFLACVGCRLSPEEALTAITLNAAAALSRAEHVGSLEVGKRFDAVALDAPGFQHLFYRFGVDLVRDVIAGGRVVVRDGRRAG